MSNVLSYSNKNAQSGNTDWIATAPYTSDDIKQIKDPNGGFSEHPRTAIPSPFAQLDLVRNAFEHLANDNLQGSTMDMRLVSNALDVAQLFFDYENHKDYITIVRWNREEQLRQLKSSPEHRLYGETLELFLNSDTKYNFDTLTNWYILMHNNRVLGGTSPSSFTIGAPVQYEFSDIKVEQGIALFSSTRHLWQRDDDFVFHLFLLFNAYPSLRERVSHVYAYFLRNLEMIRQHKPELYRRITLAINNPQALERERAGEIEQKLNQEFDAFNGDNEVTVLGARLFHRRAVDIRSQAANSDFVIVPSRSSDGEEELPLVLKSNFNGAIDNYRYIDKAWNSATTVLAGNVPINERKLPDSSVVYPFLTTSDFLTESIVMLSNPIDNTHFFDGNIALRTGGNGYLLPLKPTFFRYFNASDLMGRTLGKNIIDIVENSDSSVTVTLRIPLKKKHIELSRTYYLTSDPTWTFDEARNTGRIVKSIVSTAIFPMVRTGNDAYTAQLFSMQSQARLQFLADGFTLSGINTESKERTIESFASTYYDVKGSFDLIEVTVSNDLGTFTGIILPKWQPYAPTSKELVFAVDFGTTNSHIEVAERGHNPHPLTFTESDGACLIATLHRKGTLRAADTLQNIEFLPAEIDTLYGFPVRTTLARNAKSPGTGTALFSEVNIPFLYEREFFSGYDVTTNIKWRGDKPLSQAFLREVIMLIRAKVLIENANLERTHIVFFYPISMSGSDRNALQSTWETLYRDYISRTGIDAECLQCYPESIAPAYFYQGADVTGSSYVSIDIGGGTSDTVIYQPTADRMGSVPVAISSFRFAGNAIFGDAFSDKDADNNPLLQHYTTYFKRLIAQKPELAHLNSILDGIMLDKRSEDINAFLFSLENVQQLRSLREIDRSLYSYNTLLRNDSQRKMIFMYFYAAIIYYISMQMKQRGFERPKQIYFSGTGSKILNIVGPVSLVSDFTRLIIEKVYGSAYTERFEIKIEQQAPKQITCRGGIKLENSRLDNLADTSLYTPRNINAIKYCYSMLGDERLTFSDINQVEVRDALVNRVKEFNRFFLDLCDAQVKDEFGIEPRVLSIFSQVVNDDISNYLTAGIRAFLHNQNYNDTDELQDVPFFYPITGIIRHNLLRNLNNNTINNR